MPLRLLEEIRFWKTQEKEHTVVIQEIAPNLEAPYVALLRAWEPIFARTELIAEKLLGALIPCADVLPPWAKAQTDALLHIAAKQSRVFVEQLTKLTTDSRAIAGSPVAVTIVNHIIRESDYFLCVLETLLSSRPEQGEDTEEPLAKQLETSQTESDAREPQVEQAAPEPAPLETPVSNFELQPQLLEEADRAPAASVPIGGHTLPPLPYAYNALEPYIDETTMRIHHDKHHQSYVDGLNKAEKELEKARKSGDFALVKHWERELAFNGAGHYLHTLFWNTMGPSRGGPATGELANQIRRDFGSYDAFKRQFSEAAEKVEGGGWAILVWSPRSRRLEILTAEKHQNLSQWDVIPILPLDVWEHAYYLKHQNKRGDYIKNWWNVVNWPYADERFQKASKLVWEPY
nr:Fe-Mn family superoxide dismutase [Paenibacillus phyllosphaerae]